MSKASQEFEDCLHVAADALKVSGYSRDNDSGIAEIFLRDPYLVNFFERLNAVQYLEIIKKDGSPILGNWIFCFGPLRLLRGNSTRLDILTNRMFYNCTMRIQLRMK